MDLVSDSPLQNPEKDQLGRWEFSERIAQTISSREDSSSLVIGIYGPWGEGKTTVINFVEEALNESGGDDIISLRFNPWRTGGERELILSFFDALASELGQSLQSNTEQLGKHLINYAKALKPLKLDTVAEAAGEAIGKPGLEELKSRIEKALTDEEKRLVVFMDDIDRMDKSGIQNVFKLVKLTADFENVVYVLAFDQNLVAKALQEKYPSRKGRPGYSFLEKIVQVPLDLPTARSRTLREMCLNGIEEALDIADINLSDSEAREFSRLFGRGLAPAIDTPRMAKRYVNILSFALPILKGEVHPIDQILVEGIRLLYPDVYSHVQDNRDIYLGGVGVEVGLFGSSEGEEQDEKIEKALASLSGTEQESLRWLLGELFPDTSGSNTSKERLRKEQRVSSPEYFDRYFSYSISEREISDIELENFIDHLKRSDVEELNEALDLFIGFLEDGSPDTLISKLRARAEQHDDNSALLLSTITAICSEHFSRARKGLVGTSTFEKAYFLIEDLLEVQSSTFRRQTIEDIAQHGYLPFAARTVGQIYVSDDSESLFVEDEREAFLNELANRIESEAKEKSLIEQYSGEASSILHWWKKARDKQAPSDHLEQALEDDPREALSLLIGITPTVQSSSGERRAPFPGDLDQGQYNFLKEFADLNTIQAALDEVLGEEVEEPQYPEHFRSDDPDGTRIAKQFAAIHNRVTDEENEGSSSTENTSE